MIEVSKALYSHIETHYPECTALKPYILAQLCHESNFGRSKLAMEANNFGGMKDRPGMGDGVYIYTDWAGETENYEFCYSPDSFPELYFKFIGRGVYAGWYDYKSNGKGFIKHLERCGYCASTPGKKTWSQKIFDLMDSVKFRCLLDQLHRKEQGMSRWTEIRDRIIGNVKDSVVEEAIRLVTIKIGGVPTNVPENALDKMRELREEKKELLKKLDEREAVIRDMEAYIFQLERTSGIISDEPMFVDMEEF